MNIDRHNYETFFLLYVDNELSASERKLVDDFVYANPDLKVELELLLETTLPGEIISYHSPEALYKNEIELDALQENLLLNLDNELDGSAKKEIETAIAANDSVKKEWQIWAQTKLDPEERIIFKEKELLYRHERTRIVSMRFWRVVAAAAILLIGLFIGISVLRKDKTAADSTAKNEIKNAGEKEKTDPVNSAIIKESQNPSEKINVSDNIASTKPVESQKKEQIISDTKQHELTVKDNNIVFDQPEQNNKPLQEKTSLENINKQTSNETNSSTVLNKRNKEIISPEKTFDEMASTATIKEKITAPPKPIMDYNSIPAMPDSYAKTAGMNEGNSDNNNKIFYMNEETVSRSKAGVLFRKVKRVITRNANIKTGKGVTIAGFEIAVK